MQMDQTRLGMVPVLKSSELTSNICSVNIKYNLVDPSAHPQLLNAPVIIQCTPLGVELALIW